MPLSILYMTNQGSLDFYGGAETQIAMTMKYVNELTNGRIVAKLFDMWHDRIDRHDIIHLFKPWTFASESAFLAEYAKKCELGVVATPIEFGTIRGTDESTGRIHSAIVGGSAPIMRLAPRIPYLNYLNPNRHIEATFRACDVVLPNTREEMAWLVSRYGSLSEERCTLIPNGVETRFKRGSPSMFEEKTGISDFILFVGRIERRKNLLRLIRAFLDSALETKLVIMGKVSDRSYYEQCRGISNERIVFLPPVEHDSELLESAYKAASVVVLPSYYETPGLAALEGGLAGANLIVTREGGTREYFEDYAWYIDPSSEVSIRRALVEAYHTEKTAELSKHIESKYSWGAVASDLLKVYESVSAR